jgi:tetratricopeptide (TPR) repeat protein
MQAFEDREHGPAPPDLPLDLSTFLDCDLVLVLCELIDPALQALHKDLLAAFPPSLFLACPDGHCPDGRCDLSRGCADPCRRCIAMVPWLTELRIDQDVGGLAFRRIDCRELLDPKAGPVALLRLNAWTDDDHDHHNHDDDDDDDDDDHHHHDHHSDDCNPGHSPRAFSELGWEVLASGVLEMAVFVQRFASCPSLDLEEFRAWMAILLDTEDEDRAMTSFGRAILGFLSCKVVADNCPASAGEAYKVLVRLIVEAGGNTTKISTCQFRVGVCRMCDCGSTMLWHMAKESKKLGNVDEVLRLRHENLLVLQLANPNDDLHHDVIRAKRELAHELVENGIERGIDMIKEVLECSRRALSSDHPDYLSDLRVVAGFCHALGDFKEAAKLFREALVAHKAAVPVDHAAIANTLYNLADVLRAMGKTTEAEDTAKKVIKASKELLPEDLGVVASAYHLLAGMHRAADLSGSLMHERAAAKIMREIEDPGSLELAKTLNSLAVSLGDNLLYAEAERVHREALAIRKAAVPQPLTDIAQSSHNLAYVLKYLGKAAESVELDREALRIFESATPMNIALVRQINNNLGFELMEMGSLDEAAEKLSAALALGRKHYSAKPAVLTNSLHSLAWCYERMGRYEEAKELHMEAVALHGGADDDDDDDAAMARLQSLGYLGQMHVKASEYGEAEVILRQCLAIAEVIYEPTAMNLARAKVTLARVLHNLGSYAEALALSEQALAISRASKPLDLNFSQDTKGLIGAIQGELNKLPAVTRRALLREAKATGPPGQSRPLVPETSVSLTSEQREKLERELIEGDDTTNPKKSKGKQKGKK